MSSVIKLFSQKLVILHEQHFCRDSNAVPERVRRPLTEVQELSLKRTELDSKLKEKKMVIWSLYLILVAIKLM